MPKDTVIVRCLLCDKHHAQEQLGQGRGLFQFTAHRSHVPSLWEVRKELRLGTRRQELKQKPFRDVTSWLFYSVYYATQDHKHRGGASHSELGPSYISCHSRQLSTDLRVESLLGLFSQLKFPLPRYIEVCVK